MEINCLLQHQEHIPEDLEGALEAIAPQVDVDDDGGPFVAIMFSPMYSCCDDSGNGDSQVSSQCSVPELIGECQVTVRHIVVSAARLSTAQSCSQRLHTVLV